MICEKCLDVSDEFQVVFADENFKFRIDCILVYAGIHFMIYLFPIMKIKNA